MDTSADNRAPETDVKEGGAAATAAAHSAKDVEPPKKKKKFKKVPHEWMEDVMKMLKAAIDSAVMLEGKMRDVDKLIQETSDRRNDLESYIYAMRDSVCDALREFVSDEDKSKFEEALAVTEEWLYGDEGYDTTKEKYIGKLSELQKHGAPIERRKKEAEVRPEAVAALQKVIEQYKQFANSSDEAYAHIDDEARNACKAECKGAEDWLYEQLNVQNGLAVHADPQLLAADIETRQRTVLNVCKPIMNKPKPKPEPKPEAKPEEKKDEGGEKSKTSTPEGEDSNAAQGTQTGPDQQNAEAEKKDDKDQQSEVESVPESATPINE